MSKLCTLGVQNPPRGWNQAKSLVHPLPSRILQVLLPCVAVQNESICGVWKAERLACGSLDASLILGGPPGLRVESGRTTGIHCVWSAKTLVFCRARPCQRPAKQFSHQMIEKIVWAQLLSNSLFKCSYLSFIYKSKLWLPPKFQTRSASHGSSWPQPTLEEWDPTRFLSESRLVHLG